MTKYQKKNTITFLIVGIIILVGTYFQNRKEISLSQNRMLTIGKVIGLPVCSGSKTIKKCIHFEYLADGKWIQGSDRLNSLWPRLVRESKPQIGKYYLVEYDKLNIEYSKILITKTALTEKQVDKYLNKN